MNPIEMAFSKLKTFLRQVPERTRDGLWRRIETYRRARMIYWNSAIIAAARALGCRTLYSEDLSHGRKMEGITIINPFR